MNYFEIPLSRDVFHLLIFLSYCDSSILSQMSFFKMFTSQTTIAYCFLLTVIHADYVHYSETHFKQHAVNVL